MDLMAGRPKKDPTGAALVPITLAVTGTANKVIRSEAAARSMSLVDYLCALVAAAADRSALAARRSECSRACVCEREVRKQMDAILHRPKV